MRAGIVSFAAFICRDLSPTDSILDADDDVFCEGRSHRIVQGFSGAVIALIAVGLPLVVGFVLVRAARRYQRESAIPNKAMAQRMVAEMDVDLATAEYVIRDVTIGRSYSFLMDGYVPRHMYWCARRARASFKSTDSHTRVVAGKR